MAILVCSENHQKGMDCAVELTNKTKKLVIVLTAPEQFDELYEMFNDDLLIERVVVLAKSVPSLCEWEKFLSLGGFYGNVEVCWVTPRH